METLTIIPQENVEKNLIEWELNLCHRKRCITTCYAIPLILPQHNSVYWLKYYITCLILHMPGHQLYSLGHAPPNGLGWVNDHMGMSLIGKHWEKWGNGAVWLPFWESSLDFSKSWVTATSILCQLLEWSVTPTLLEKLIGFRIISATCDINIHVIKQICIAHAVGRISVHIQHVLQ